MIDGGVADLADVRAARPHPGSQVYRPDIDGLRALSVLAVIVFHFSPSHLPGGFVGVDVFFAISGYLITRLLLIDLEASSLDIVSFYRRRIRRIFPALAAMLLAVLSLGFAITLPYDYSVIGSEVTSGGLFVANFQLLHETGYFSGDRQPLLHLWSLGVEEQFYIIWPLLIWLCFRFRLTAITAVFTASFALNLVFFLRDPVATFYLPQTRIWELAAGALLASGERRFPVIAQADGTLGTAMSAAGAALITAGLFFTKQAGFPGWWPLLPLAGTVLLIAAGPDALVNRRVLANRSLVWIGLISYPLYLWHWPLLAMIRIYGPDNTAALRGLKIAALLATVALSAITYRYIELPIRRGDLSRVSNALVIVMLSVVAAGALISFSRGFPQRYRGTDREIVNEISRGAAAAKDAFRDGVCFRGDIQNLATAFPSECRATREPTVTLWGDSHAADLYAGLASLYPRPSDRISQFTVAACPPVADIEDPIVPNCGEINAAILAEIRARAAGTVILSAAWAAYYDRPNFLLLLRATIDGLKTSGANVVIVGQAPVFPTTQGRYLFGGVVGDGTAVNPMLPRLREIDEALRKLAADETVQYVSPLSGLCRGDHCYITIPGDGPLRLFSYDSGHLTQAGSIYYAKTFLGPDLVISATR